MLPAHKSWLKKVISELRSYPTNEELFNLWNDSVPSLEVENSAYLRRENFKKYFSYWLENSPKLMLIGEAPGYAGSRFTGISFTSERIIREGRLPDFMKRLNLKTTSRRMEGYSEQSATIIWRELIKVDSPIALFMTVPWHPHQKGKPLTNRKPRKDEICAGINILELFLEAFAKTRFIAIGKVAEGALKSLGVQAIYLRHPAQGGATKFREGFKALVKSL